MQVFKVEKQIKLLAPVFLFFCHFCAGQQVTLYDHGQYQGASKTLSVSRCHNVPDFSDRTSSIRTTGCVVLYEDHCCLGPSYQVPSDNAALWSFNDRLTSISPCGNYFSSLPPTIQETWLSHTQTMRKVAEDGDIAIYYNDAVKQSSATINNHRDMVKRIWTYTKQTYGPYFGPEGGRLIAYFHASHPGASSIQTYFDSTSDCRNLVDLSSSSPDAYSSPLAGGELDFLTHEIGHIVEGAGNGVHFSPAYFLWGDSKWAEIFIYDVYSALGLTQERTRFQNLVWNYRETFPKADTYWFRDWFYPVYTNYGGSRVLNNYFNLLAQYFPRVGNGWEYHGRTITLGEFVHFFSGAAQANLKGLAVTAFKWNAADEAQWEQARRDFPNIRYENQDFEEIP